MAGIELKQIWKRYPDGFEAVKDVSIEVADGEFMILVGPPPAATRRSPASCAPGSTAAAR